MTLKEYEHDPSYETRERIRRQKLADKRDPTDRKMPPFESRADEYLMWTEGSYNVLKRSKLPYAKWMWWDMGCGQIHQVKGRDKTPMTGVTRSDLQYHGSYYD